MAENETELVTFKRHGDVVEAQLSVLIDEHLEQVWSAITEPQFLVQWLAAGQIDLRLGGPVKLDFADSGIVIDSSVTALTPQRLLEYSWSGPEGPDRPTRWSLEPVGPMTRVTLTLILPAGEDVARSCAGWAAHLEMLIAALAGIPIKFPFATFKDARETYRAQMAAHAA